MSSKKTNMLNRSPLRQKPAIAARKTSISAWNTWLTVARWCQAKRRAATTITAEKVARPAPSRSIVKETPSATPWRGCQPPNQ
jgi:hypothetical protein